MRRLFEARIWRRRHGGDLYQFAPLVISARTRLRERLPLMAAYCAEARRIAAALDGLPGVAVKPNPPQTNMMHVYLKCSAEELAERGLRLAAEEKVLLFAHAVPAEIPGWSVVEMTVTSAESDFETTEIRELFARLLAG